MKHLIVTRKHWCNLDVNLPGRSGKYIAAYDAKHHEFPRTLRKRI